MEIKTTNTSFKRLIISFKQHDYYIVKRYMMECKLKQENQKGILKQEKHEKLKQQICWLNGLSFFLSNITRIEFKTRKLKRESKQQRFCFDDFYI